MEEYRRREDNIKMDLKEIGVDVMSWIYSASAKGFWSFFVNAGLEHMGLAEVE